MLIKKTLEKLLLNLKSRGNAKNTQKRTFQLAALHPAVFLIEKSAFFETNKTLSTFIL